MTPLPNRSASEDDDGRIISPFAQTRATIQQSTNLGKASWPFWFVSALLVCVILGIISYFAIKYLDNPYRTMEPFSVDKYFQDYSPMAGSKFKADLKVAADLGWKDGVGRLMVFTEENDMRPIAVLIPPKLSGIFFTKGQTYQISLEVGEGGLIYADACEKD